jgi:hypothetical protein
MGQLLSIAAEVPGLHHRGVANRARLLVVSLQPQRRDHDSEAASQASDRMRAQHTPCPCARSHMHTRARPLPAHTHIHTHGDRPGCPPRGRCGKNREDRRSSRRSQRSARASTRARWWAASRKRSGSASRCRCRPTRARSHAYACARFSPFPRTQTHCEQGASRASQVQRARASTSGALRPAAQAARGLLTAWGPHTHHQIRLE